MTSGIAPFPKCKDYKNIKIEVSGWEKEEINLDIDESKARELRDNAEVEEHCCNQEIHNAERELGNRLVFEDDCSSLDIMPIGLGF